MQVYSSMLTWIECRHVSDAAGADTAVFHNSVVVNTLAGFQNGKQSQ